MAKGWHKKLSLFQVLCHDWLESNVKQIGRVKDNPVMKRNGAKVDIIQFL